MEESRSTDYFREDDFKTIPVIDVSRIALTSSRPTAGDYQQVAASLAQALSTWGFAYLTHHGIRQNTINACFKQSKNFFKLPQQVKDKFKRGIESVHGYSQKGREILEKNVVEAKESFDVLCTSNDLPENHVPRLRSDLDDLAQEAGSLAKRLLRCLALDLQIDSEQFLGEHSGMLTGDGNNGSSLRLLHYPPTDEHQHYSADEQNEVGQNRQKITRCGKHTDYGGLTLLFQDSLGGLEVQTLDGGTQWTQAPPIEGSIVVNIGDLLQFWSAGKYRATPHRVVVDSTTSQNSRYSIAIFVHPNHDTLIKPLGKLIGSSSNFGKQETELEPSWASRTAKDHINKRFVETYLN